MNELPKDVINMVDGYLNHNIKYKERQKDNFFVFKLHVTTNSGTDKYRACFEPINNEQKNTYIKKITKFIDGKSHKISLGDNLIIKRTDIINIRCSSTYSKKCSSTLATDLIDWLKHIIEVLQVAEITQVVRHKGSFHNHGYKCDDSN